MSGNKKYEAMIEKVKKLVEQHGNKVAIDTEGCALWKKEHLGGCTDCSSELGCHKAIKLACTISLSILYTRDCVDSEKMKMRISEFKDRILKAKTMEELSKVKNPLTT